MKLLGLPVQVLDPDIDESFDPALPPQEVVRDLACRKVEKALFLLKEQGIEAPWILGGDTLIYHEGSYYGKAADRQEARAMLEALSGGTHEVHSGLALHGGGVLDHCSVRSRVSFAPMGSSELDWYLDSGEWEGAAGAYKIQGLISCFIESIEGSYSSIVGLPLREFYVMLKRNGYPYGAWSSL
ncbi:MAG: Maf family protein [Treponema sp.]|nr:Maf family protein [Treponema sp.]